jgi:hypothetical protein
MSFKQIYKLINMLIFLNLWMNPKNRTNLIISQTIFLNRDDVVAVANFKHQFIGNE